MSESVLHGTAVAHHGRAALLIGPSGSGKSALALQLVSLGARLICDDRAALRREGDRIKVQARPGFEGRIEARGVGLLTVPHLAEAELALVVDLGQTTQERLPPPRSRELLGLPIPLVLRAEGAHFPAAILFLLESGLWV